MKVAFLAIHRESQWYFEILPRVLLRCSGGYLAAIHHLMIFWRLSVKGIWRGATTFFIKIFRPWILSVQILVSIEISVTGGVPMVTMRLITTESTIPSVPTKWVHIAPKQQLTNRFDRVHLIGQLHKLRAKLPWKILWRNYTGITKSLGRGV